MKHSESRLQSSCVYWFRLQYAGISNLLFAIPNGGRRDKVTAAILKGEGVIAGCPDLLLLVPNTQYHSLCIEMKTEKGRQSDSQRQFQQMAESAGNHYVVCRSFDQFRDEIKTYLNG